MATVSFRSSWPTSETAIDVFHVSPETLKHSTKHRAQLPSVEARRADTMLRDARTSRKLSPLRFLQLQRVASDTQYQQMGRGLAGTFTLRTTFSSPSSVLRIPAGGPPCISRDYVDLRAYFGQQPPPEHVSRRCWVLDPYIEYMHGKHV